MKKILLGVAIIAIISTSCSKQKEDVPAPKTEKVTYFRIQSNNKTGDTLYSKIIRVSETK